MKRKSRKQKHNDYVNKFGHIPIDYKERLEWLYDELKITDKQACSIMDKRNAMMSSLSYVSTKIVLFELPEGSPRPRARLINRANISNMAMSNSNFIHVYSLTGKEDNLFMKRLVSQEDFNQLDGIIHTPANVEINAFFKTPTYYSKEDIFLAEIGIHRPVYKPDWDNIGKKYSDMFNSNIWLDDDLVIDGSVHKYYSVLPRIEINLSYLNMLYNKHQYNSIINRIGGSDCGEVLYYQNYWESAEK